MKRSEAPSPSGSTTKSKKTKFNAPTSVGLSQPLSQQDTSGNSPEGGEWTKVEKRKSKKAKNIGTKLDNAPPLFMYSNGEITKRRDAVGISDIRDLVLHIAADAPPPGWLRVENPRSIQKVVTLLIPGLTPSALSLPALPTSATSNPNLPLSIPALDSANTDLPFISSTFSHACPTRAPGDHYRMHSIMSDFFQGPVTGEEKRRRTEQRLALERTMEKSPARYILSLEEMIENEYPIPSYLSDVFEKPPGWVETPAPSEEDVDGPKESGKVFSIDCEMCLTEDGNELARVCIIEYETGMVVYDRLVKPQKPIIDYLTRWSGITADSLAGVTTTFDEVQAHVLWVLSATPTPVLLGHSLESDLKALKICHPVCIDTAIIFHHPRGRPLKPGLAWLTKKWCGKMIQNRGEGGHDPEEDARACLELLRKKVQNGPGYGEFRTDYESIFDRMKRSGGRAGVSGVRSVVVDHGNPAVMHGAKASSTVSCKTDDEVLEGLLNAIPSHEFAFARFTAVADAAGWITQKASIDAPNLPVQPEPTAEHMALVFAGLNDHLTRLYAALPPRTALIVFTGHSDPRKMAALNARKQAFEQALRLGVSADDLDVDKRWTNVDARELEEEVEMAKRGLMFLCIKSAK